MTTNVIYEKVFYFKKGFFSFEVAKELWYVTNDKERSYIYFGASKVSMNKYPNITVYNVHLGTIALRYFRDNGEVQ